MIKPIGERVLVLPNEVSETFVEGGELVRPDISRERPQEGTVVAIGDLVRRVTVTKDFSPTVGGRIEIGAGTETVVVGTEPVVKVGNQVFYGKFSGSELRVDGIEFVILLVDDILGITDPAAKLEDLVAAAGRTLPKPKPHPLSRPEESTIIQP